MYENRVQYKVISLHYIRLLSITLHYNTLHYIPSVQILLFNYCRYIVFFFNMFHIYNFSVLPGCNFVMH